MLKGISVIIIEVRKSFETNRKMCESFLKDYRKTRDPYLIIQIILLLFIFSYLCFSYSYVNEAPLTNVRN